MIKNEGQYRITKAAAEKFAQSLASFDSAPPPSGVHPLIRKAERDALAGWSEDLQEQIHDYEPLKRESVPVAEAAS